MGVLISQLLEFKTMCFNIVFSSLGIQELNVIAVYNIPTTYGIYDIVTPNKSMGQKIER